MNDKILEVIRAKLIEKYIGKFDTIYIKDRVTIAHNVSVYTLDIGFAYTLRSFSVVQDIGEEMMDSALFKGVHIFIWPEVTIGDWGTNTIMVEIRTPKGAGE